MQNKELAEKLHEQLFKKIEIGKYTYVLQIRLECWFNWYAIIKQI